MHSIPQGSFLRRTFFVSIVLLLAIGLTATVIGAGGYGERLSNGSFEEGFGSNGVGLGWVGFNNGGAAEYVYADDLGPRFLFDGKHSQFLRISTMQYFVTDPERYSGIYQTVAVVAGTQYTLTMHGMLRVLPNDPDKNNWSYIVQWGIDPNGGTDWGKVSWNDVPWGTTYNEDDTGALSYYTTTVTAPSNKITLFIRALKKFPTRYRTFFVNLDGISLTGQTPTTSDKDSATSTGGPKLDVTWPTLPYVTKPFTVHASSSDSVGVSSIKLFEEDKQIAESTHAVGPLATEVDFTWTPTITGTRTLTVTATNAFDKTTTLTKTLQVAPIAEYIKNGDFEKGFDPSGVALQWGSFMNGGRHTLEQLYDDTWKPVVASGAHSQLIEISSIGEGESDPLQEGDRYAGICQVISGLTKGATYYVSAKGIIRINERDKNTDDWSWAAQWGYNTGADATCANWNNVTQWEVLPWGHVDYRESPTKMNSFTTTFVAPSDTMTVYFRAWRKWAIGARELLVNFDDISVAGYKGQ